MVLDLRLSALEGAAVCRCIGVNCNHKCNHQTCRRTDSETTSVGPARSSSRRRTLAFSSLVSVRSSLVAPWRCPKSIGAWIAQRRAVSLPPSGRATPSAPR